MTSFELSGSAQNLNIEDFGDPIVFGLVAFHETGLVASRSVWFLSDIRMCDPCILVEYVHTFFYTNYELVGNGTHPLWKPPPSASDKPPEVFQRLDGSTVLMNRNSWIYFIVSLAFY